MNRNFWHKHGHTVIIYVFLAALMVFVSIFNKDFFTLGNFKNLLRSSFPLLMAALGQTLIILTGGIDLSLGGIVALCNVVCVMSMNPDSAWGFVPALGAAAAVGLACGAVNGVLVTKGRLAPIIVTIATTAVFDGMALLLMPNPGGSVHKAFAKFLTRGYSGAVPFLLFLLILCLVRSLANSTPYGKALRAIGGSENAAYSTGIVLNELDLEPDSWCCFLQVELDDHSLSKLSDDIRYASERRFSALSQILFGDSSYLLESHQYSYSVCLTSRSRMELAARRKILVDTIRRQFPHEGSYCDVSIASGSIVQGIRLLHKSVQTCHEAGKLHFIKGSNADIFYEEVESYIYNEPEDSQGYPIPDTRLITFIKEQNKEGITGELEQLKTWLYQKGSESYLYMTFSLGSFYTHLMKELGESGINLQDIFQNPIEEFKKVAAGGTLESSIENLKQNLFKICDSIRINKSRYGKLIDQAILYIQNHYMSSSFSIDEVAGAVCLSTSYFSTVFKSETGITFTDYLIKVRMEKARGLLENTSMKMYEISSRAGYENAAYFSAAFKRYYGKSPSEFQSRK